MWVSRTILTRNPNASARTRYCSTSRTGSISTASPASREPSRYAEFPNSSATNVSSMRSFVWVIVFVLLFQALVCAPAGLLPERRFALPGRMNGAACRERFVHQDGHQQAASQHEERGKPEARQRAEGIAAIPPESVDAQRTRAPAWMRDIADGCQQRRVQQRHPDAHQSCAHDPPQQRGAACDQCDPPC